MRILSIVKTIAAESGGPIEVARQRSRTLAAMGHEAEILTLDAPVVVNPALNGIPIHYLGPSLTGFGLNFRLIPWLRANRGRYDGLIVDGIWRFQSLGVWAGRRAHRLPYFVFVHGALDPWFKVHYPLKHMKKWLYWPWAEYWTLRQAKAVLFTTQEELLLARQSFWLYRAKEAVVGAGIDQPQVSAAASSGAPALEAFPQLRGKRLILFLGRIHEKKGCDMLIAAFAATAESDTALHLVMAGPDSAGERRRLEDLAQRLDIGHRLTWTGMLSGELKWAMLHAAEAFVLPSHSENFGVSVVEALACGVPVLISDKVNIWREVQQDGAGIVDRDDRQGTERLLRQWLSLPVEERAAMALAARRCFQARFESANSARALIAVMRGD